MLHIVAIAHRTWCSQAPVQETDIKRNTNSTQQVLLYPSSKRLRNSECNASTQFTHQCLMLVNTGIRGWYELNLIYTFTFFNYRFWFKSHIIFSQFLYFECTKMKTRILLKDSSLHSLQPPLMKGYDTRLYQHPTKDEFVLLKKGRSTSLWLKCQYPTYNVT